MSGHDLVIKNGTLIDPSQGLHSRKDIAVNGGRIAAVEDHIPDGDARDLIEADGLLVTPGLVDLHVHIWWGVAHLAIEADATSLACGATTVVDAGSSGANTFPGFRRYVVDQIRARSFAFLHISGMGQLDRDIGELEDIRWARVDPAVETANANRDVIVGIKVRLSEGIVGVNDVVALERAIEAADHLDLPVMIHIGGTNHSLEEIFGKLRGGDIVTHSFTSNAPGIITDGGKILPAALEARQRGVLFDVGHGAGSFGFEVAEAALTHGFTPATISSDVHRYNVRGPVYDLATTLSKFMHLGLSVDDVISLGTQAPAEAIGRLDEVGTLKPGAIADIAVFKMQKGPIEFRDARGAVRLGDRVLSPVETVRAGRRYSPFHQAHHNHSHPQGF
jgi:dihydroorotase